MYILFDCPVATPLISLTEILDFLFLRDALLPRFEIGIYILVWIQWQSVFDGVVTTYARINFLQRGIFFS